jgi:hypothetical protein
LERSRPRQACPCSVTATSRHTPTLWCASAHTLTLGPSPHLRCAASRMEHGKESRSHGSRLANLTQQLSHGWMPLLLAMLPTRSSCPLSVTRSVTRTASPPSLAGSFPGRSQILTRTCNPTQRIREVSGCDGVMIGRAAIDSPWVFRELTGRAPPGSWPHVAEVDAAVAEFHSWRDEHDGSSDPRFAHPPPRATVANFHAQNFHRIRVQVRSGLGHGPSVELGARSHHLSLRIPAVCSVPTSMRVVPT